MPGINILTLYAYKLFQVIKKHSPTAHAYADDTQFIYLLNQRVMQMRRSI